ncbi:MAG: sigma 54-interacting transcriptional regulator [bacterium]
MISSNLASALEENRYFRERERRHYLFKELVVESPAMRMTFEKLNSVVDAPTPVLLVGESGTGKELLARALHHFCAQRDGMLFRLNCAKTLDADIDVEMFGCVASEFQGAIAPRKGVFELAADGTVFLEEIDVLSPMIQGKLVRMLKEGEVRRVGDPVGRPVRARLVASTNRPISELVESNKLRRDLYLLLKDNIIDVPPLRQRNEDILPLARTFLKNYAQRYGRPVQRFDEEVLERLSNHDWPGNVRELQLMIESAVLKCDEDTIRIVHLCT